MADFGSLAVRGGRRRSWGRIGRERVGGVVGLHGYDLNHIARVLPLPPFNFCNLYALILGNFIQSMRAFPKTSKSAQVPYEIFHYLRLGTMPILILQDSLAIAWELQIATLRHSLVIIKL